jgi:hypothetical protein
VEANYSVNNVSSVLNQIQWLSSVVHCNLNAER